MLTTIKKQEVFIKIEVKDNNVEQAIRVLKRKLQKRGFFKVMKMKSTYEKPSEKKKKIKTENLKRIKKQQKLKIDTNLFMRIICHKVKLNGLALKKGMGL